MHRRKTSAGENEETTEIASPTAAGTTPVKPRLASPPASATSWPMSNTSSSSSSSSDKYRARSPLSSPTGDATPPRHRSAGSSSSLRVSSPLSPLANGSKSPVLRAYQPPIRQSTYPDPPLTTSPFRTSFSFAPIPENGDTNGAPSEPPSRHARHSRSQSGVGYYGYSPTYGYASSYAADSPVSSASPLSAPPRSPRLGAPPSPLVPLEEVNGASAAPRDAKRHSRIHSRNLSVFFPRPGAVQSAAIAEDGGQEVDYPAPEVIIPPVNGDADSGGTFNSGFKFGEKNPDPLPPLSPLPNVPKRRGHHHKHSVSHNFFSFMDPTSSFTPSNGSLAPAPTMNGNGASPSLGDQALPTPSTTHFPSSSTQHHFVTPKVGEHTSAISSTRSAGILASLALQAKSFAAAQFIIGSWLWVEGQRQGSLGCTGLGYWVVFDAVGIWVGYLGERFRREPRSAGRSYGSRRVETVALFAEAIYLMFASVYVCKEAFEHLLLSSEIPDAGDSHHHHSIDESLVSLGLQYPTTLLWISLCTLLCSSFLFNNHDRLVEATGNHLPTPLSLVNSVTTMGQSPTRPGIRSSWAIARLVSNPFTVLPVFFSSTLLLVSTFVPPARHHQADIALACLETMTTFMVGYPAAVALGKVLLQTAPRRGLPGGQMEAFLRVMRELEHHHQIVHLPAPHLWQLTPLPPGASGTRVTVGSPYRSTEHDDLSSEEGTLVATVQLHVRKDLDDTDVLKLSSDVWEQCTRALGVSGAGVTVSVVRG